ncbi:RDD family protein [Streptomyces sp. CC219B]|uniref:RDD family protein n=1 Tax=Streptomyces sp. CC219B TaxID=3044574 RepID=UPI0024A9C416|nr:RDD family protein [Streptomyces sp. CC219B]
MSAPTPAPGDDRPREGYYPDPSIPGYVRYWNGAAWVPGTSRPAPPDGEPLAAPSGGGGAASAAVEETGPHFFDEDPVDGPGPAQAQHGSRPEPASAWGADRSRQSGFGGDQDRRVSWGAPQGTDPRDPRTAAPADGAAAAPAEGTAPRTDGTATIPPAEPDEQDAPSGNTFLFRRPTPGPAAGNAAGPAADDGTMTFRAVSPRTGQQDGAPAAQPGRTTPSAGGRGAPGAGGTATGSAGAGGLGGPSGAGAGGFGSSGAGAAGAAAGQGAGPAGAGGFGGPAGAVAGGGAPQGPGFRAGKAAAERASAAQAQGAQAAVSSAGAPVGPQAAVPTALSGPQAPAPAAPAVPQQAGPQGGSAAPVSSGVGGGQSSWAQQVHRLAGAGEDQPVAPWKPPVEDVFQAAARRQANARPAGLGKRLAARLLDTVVVVGVTAGAAVPLGTRAVDHVTAKIDEAKLSGETVTVWLLDGTTSTYLGIVLAVLLLFGVLYEAVPTAKWGRTLGKKLLGLEVRDIEAHEPPSFGGALRRWLVYSVPGLLLVGVVGVLWCLFDKPWRQCWHDKAARTFVAG